MEYTLLGFVFGLLGFVLGPVGLGLGLQCIFRGQFVDMCNAKCWCLNQCKPPTRTHCRSGGILAIIDMHLSGGEGVIAISLLT